MHSPTSDGAESQPLVRANWKEPRRATAAWHRLKVWGHIGLRTARNLASGPARIGPGQALVDAPVVAEQRSSLWVDGRADEFILRCGKVQNLRVAARCFDGVEVAAGQTLSFWAQVGRPSAGRGFAVGREIINGCVVPTVGGGLCQLSNALAALALASGARLAERHRHSALIEAQAQPSEDATVAWNYVDLRIVADFSFRIEAEVGPDELLLRLRSHAVAAPTALRRALPPIREERAVARGCLTCAQTTCFRHQPQARVNSGRTAVLLNDRYPELAIWLEGLPPDADWMLPWVRPALRHRSWKAPQGAQVAIAHWPSFKRIVRQRLQRGEGAAHQAARMRTAWDLARDYARRLRPEHTDLVVAQELLVPLWRLGALGGRRVNVYVSELPASVLQAKLDQAVSLTPGHASLRDFRVDQAWQHDEWKALAYANRRLTPHHEVHRTLCDAGMTADLLPWDLPPASVQATPDAGRPLTLTLASSALARKGAAEVAAAAQVLDARVLVLGSPPSDVAAWSGVNWSAVGYAGDWIAQSDVVVLPAYIEHQPRALLKALAAGVPVVASPACGLGARAGLTEVAPGNVDTLVAAIRAALSGRCS